MIKMAGYALVGLVILPAAAPAAQLAPVLDQQVQIERALTLVINEALDRIAGRGRAHVVVSVKLAGRLLTQTKQQSARAMSFTLGRVSSERRMKLPGLPSLGGGGKLPQPVKIKLAPKGKRSVTTSLVTEVERMRLRLYVDPGLPSDRLKAARQAATELAGLDAKRGDSLQVIELAPLTLMEKEAPPPSPWITPAYIALVAFPLSLIVGTALIALGLGRGRQRGKSGDGTSIAMSLERPAKEVDEVDSEAPEPGAIAPDLAGAVGVRFESLRAAKGTELSHVLERLDDDASATVLALGALPPETVRAAFDALDPKRRAKIAGQLGSERSVITARLSELEERCDELLHEAQHPTELKVGGAGQLARLLTSLSRSSVKLVMEALQRSNADLARRTRDRLTQFEDLPRLPLELRRRLVSSVEIAVLARALHDAGEQIDKAVHEAVSKRQAKFLAEELRTVGDVSDDDVEQARESIQQMMATLSSA